MPAKISVYIDVWDEKAALAFSKYGQNHSIITKYVHADDLPDWDLSYSDLVEAVDAKGSIHKSGWYPLTEKIRQRVRGRDGRARAMFNE
jgi:hypothetical protein